MSKTKLVEIANIFATPYWNRLDRIKAADFIQGFHANVALDRINDFTQIIVTVVLIHHRKAEFDHFGVFTQELDEITECIGGGMDKSWQLAHLLPEARPFVASRGMQSYHSDADSSSNPFKPGFDRLVKAGFISKAALRHIQEQGSHEPAIIGTHVYLRRG